VIASRPPRRSYSVLAGAGAGGGGGSTAGGGASTTGAGAAGFGPPPHAHNQIPSNAQPIFILSVVTPIARAQQAARDARFLRALDERHRTSDLPSAAAQRAIAFARLRSRVM
jgi:hypothetical protein